MKTATTLKEYVDHQDEVTKIDVSTFDTDELRGLVAELSKFKDLPSVKLIGMPKDIEKNQDAIKALLDLANWDLSEEDQRHLRETFKVDLWDFTAFSDDRDVPVEGWILQINLGFDFEQSVASLGYTGYYRNSAIWAADKGFDGVEKALMLMIEKRPSVMERADWSFARFALKHSTGLLKLIIKDSPKVLLGSHNGYTLAMFAAQDGLEEILALMIKTNPNVLDARNFDEYTPAIYAAMGGHEKVLALMIETNPKVLLDESYEGMTPALWAAMYGHEKVLVLICESILMHNLDKDAAKWDEAVKRALTQDIARETRPPMFPEANVTTKEELDAWITKLAINNIKINQVKDIIQHFRTMASKDKGVAGLNIIDMPSGALAPIAQQLIASSYPDENLLDIGQIGMVINYALKKGPLQTEPLFRSSLDSLFQDLGLSDVTAPRELSGKDEEEEEDIVLKRQKKR